MTIETTRLAEYSLPPIDGIDESLWDNNFAFDEDGLWSPTFLNKNTNTPFYNSNHSSSPTLLSGIDESPTPSPPPRPPRNPNRLRPIKPDNNGDTIISLDRSNFTVTPPTVQPLRIQRSTNAESTQNADAQRSEDSAQPLKRLPMVFRGMKGRIASGVATAVSATEMKSRQLFMTYGTAKPRFGHKKSHSLAVSSPLSPLVNTGTEIPVIDISRPSLDISAGDHTADVEEDPSNSGESSGPLSPFEMVEMEDEEPQPQSRFERYAHPYTDADADTEDPYYSTPMSHYLNHPLSPIPPPVPSKDTPTSATASFRRFHLPANLNGIFSSSTESLPLPIRIIESGTASLSRLKPRAKPVLDLTVQSWFKRGMMEDCESAKDREHDAGSAPKKPFFLERTSSPLANTIDLSPTSIYPDSPSIYRYPSSSSYSSPNQDQNQNHQSHQPRRDSMPILQARGSPLRPDSDASESPSFSNRFEFTGAKARDWVERLGRRSADTPRPSRFDSRGWRWRQSEPDHETDLSSFLPL